MKNIRDELRSVIIGNEPSGDASKLKKTQNFLRGNASAGFDAKEKQYLKSEEEKRLIKFIEQEALFFEAEISERNFISSGAEQRVYRYDDFHVIKTNDSIFYAYWLDYFNSLLVHNYLFPSTYYDFLEFKILDHKLYAVVKQEFIISTETTNLDAIRAFLFYNNFKNTRIRLSAP